MPGSGIVFGEKEVGLFSKASGDFNPIHLDDVFASRTQYRKPVVFAIQALLSSLCRFYKTPIVLTKLDIKFVSPVFLDEKLCTKLGNSS